MTHIDWALTAKGILYVILVCVVLGLYMSIVVAIGRYLAQLDYEQQERVARLARLERLAAIAEEVEGAPEHERERLYREAQALSDDWSRDDAA